ncbi:enoyl-CoA hydratase/isomerase family protein [Aquirhabdus sp.]|uniref:enoyl-CoA hydratase/isomerase family protein n=1 Tax=Aquirhabdus sp. TaxID=2824160 RepID=UPI00396C34EB
MTLPETQTLILEQQGAILHVRLNRPDARNAMSQLMVTELIELFTTLADSETIRGVVLRGKGGNFCSGGDIKDMSNLRLLANQEGSNAAYVAFNRGFGTLINLVNQAPQVVVAVLEGAVLGGGFGLVCVSDVALCLDSAKFGLPETGLGVIPAQIAPFVVQRIGLTQARRLALLGNRFGGAEAYRIGLVHELFSSVDALNAAIDEVVGQIRRTAPKASRVTKSILHRVGHVPLDTLLDDVAVQFAEAVSGSEGLEGTMAFVQKRLPTWAE